MHADMEKLLAHFSKTNNVMVASVQCDGSGKQTCTSNGISSYPSIYYTDDTNGQQKKYTGGTDYDSMYRFIDQICGGSPGPSPPSPPGPAPMPSPSPGPAPAPPSPSGKSCEWNSDCPPGQSCYVNAGSSTGICKSSPGPSPPAPGPSPEPPSPWPPSPSPGPAPAPPSPSGKSCEWNSDCPAGQECYLNAGSSTGICSSSPPWAMIV